ncbi:MAG: flippase [Bacilli bacterium]|nr:flippase [Bacilli bacterium]
MVKSIIERFKNSKIIKNSIWMILATIVQMVISLFINIFVARYLGVNNYGILNYGLSFVNFFLAICNLGLNTIVIKYLIDEKNNHGEILGTCILLRFFAGLISMLLIFLIVFILKGNDKLIIYTTVLQSISLIFDSFSTISLWYQHRLESKFIAIITFFAYICMALYKVYLLIAKKNLLWFAVSHCVSGLVTSILLFLLYNYHKGPKFKFSLKKGLKMLRQSYHFIISSLMVAVYAQIDKIMIGSMINDISAVGYYSVATTIVSLWSFLPTAVNHSFQPVILEAKNKNENDYQNKMKQLYSIIIWLSIAYTIFILIFGRLLIIILYGKEYLAGLSALKICIFGVTFSFIGVVREFWLICENKQKYAKWFALIGVVTNIVINAILIPYFGINGAAIATALTQFMTGIIASLIFKDTRDSFYHVMCGLTFNFKSQKQL